jgi:hypothetical protein
MSEYKIPKGAESESSANPFMPEARVGWGEITHARRSSHARVRAAINRQHPHIVKSQP